MSATQAADLRVKLEEVNGQIEDKDREAKSRWQEFEQAREQFAAAGNEANRSDSEEFQKAEEIHKRYSESAEGLRDLEGVRNGIFQMLGESAPQERQAKGDPTDPRRESLSGKSLGQRAIESEDYKQAKNAGVLDRTSVALGTMHLADVSFAEQQQMLNPQAALITGGSDTSAGSFIERDDKGYVPQPRRMTRILDLITQGQTNSDQVKYVRQSAFTNVAAETAEATSTTTGTKPEATIAFAIVTEAVKTIAHWVPAARQALSDAGQLRTLIDSQLRYGLEYRLESQIVAGGGTGEDLTGIQNTSNILSQAKGSLSVADAIHKAITQIRLGFIEPNGVALHPNDWEILRLARDDGGSIAGTGNYLYGPPALAGTQQIWGLPVAVTPAVSDDTGLVGDFRYATLWLREGAQVLATDSHDDFFVKNLIAILAEMRAAFGVQLPAAFCKVTSLD